MNIEATVREECAQFGTEDLTKSSDDGDIWRKRKKLFPKGAGSDSGRLEEGDLSGLGNPSHRRRLQAPTPPNLSIGLTDNADDLMGRRDQPLQSLAGEGGRPHENNLHGPLDFVETLNLGFAVVQGGFVPKHPVLAEDLTFVNRVQAVDEVDPF